VSGGIFSPSLTSALDGGMWSASCPGRFTPEKKASGTHWIGGWVGPRASLDTVEKRKILPLLWVNPKHAAHSLLLYQLNYPNSYTTVRGILFSYVITPFFISYSYNSLQVPQLHQNNFWLCLKQFFTTSFCDLYSFKMKFHQSLL
jgi:hypothetical protein